MTDDERLLALATSVADGGPVDWEAATRMLAGSKDLETIERLRLIEKIASPARQAQDNAGPDLPPGSTWGPLSILQKIGAGTFGDVYRAWDNRLEREVALKLLRETTPIEQASLVVREGSRLARVHHAGVVTVYGAERIDGRTGIWMELVAGTTLEQELEERGAYPVDEVLVAGIAIADALESVHRAGLIHGDVKTRNVIRDTNGRLVLTDFGSSDEVSSRLSAAATATPLYAAPEVLEGAPASAQSDVYSLGVLLWRLSTQRYLVEGQSLREVREAHRTGRGQSHALAASPLSAPFIAVIQRATAVDLERRFRSAAALRDALRAVLTPGSAVPVPHTRSTRATQAVAGIVAVAVLAGATLGIRAFTAPPSGKPTSVRAANGRGTSVPVYEHYLVARALLDRRRPKDALRAVHVFERVISADPEFAPAYAGLAMALGQLGSSERPGQELPPAITNIAEREAAAISRALRLDPTLAEAYTAQGGMLARQGDWASAEGAFRQALALNRYFVPAYSRFATSTLIPLGQLEEARAMVDRALALDPLSLDALRALARIQIHAGQPEAALETHAKIVANDAEFPLRDRQRGEALILAGRIPEAIALLRRDPGDAPFLAYAYALSGHREQALALAERERDWPLVAAFARAGLGDAEEAINALMALATQRKWSAAYYLAGPEFDGLRDSPRMGELRARLNLPEHGTVPALLQRP